MKILLLNPASELVLDSKQCRRFFAPIMPLNLGYLGAVLQKAGFEVVILDQFAKKLTPADTISQILKQQPDILGVSLLTPVASSALELFANLKAKLPQIKIVAGNIHASLFYEDMLSLGNVDFCVLQEGEVSFLALCEALRNKSDISAVNGIVYLSDNKCIVTGKQQPVGDLDALPYPAWDFFDLDLYKSAPMLGFDDIRILPILGSRGCPYRCYYCSQDKVYETFRMRKISAVVDEMEYMVKKHGAEAFGFCDAYFPWDEESCYEFCNELKKRKLHVKWVTETRVDKVNKEMLQAMADVGLHLIMYGIESGDQDVLDSVAKKASVSDAKNAVDWAKEAGILVQGLFILGLPADTKQSCQKTIDFALSLNIDIAKFNLAIPYPGSAFYTDFGKGKKSGEEFFSWVDWTNYEGKLMFVPEGMTSDELKFMQRYAMFRFYLRPLVIINFLFNLRMLKISTVFAGGIMLIKMMLTGLFKLKK